MRSEQESIRAVDLYADTVRRICVLYLKNHADTEDVFQTVFLKYLTTKIQFENKDHEKSWIIRVTINACKDFRKNFFRSHTTSLEEVQQLACDVSEEYPEVLSAVLSLPSKYKEVVYLFYYEEYTAVEISKILKKNVNTVYTLLSRAKKLLREKLGGEGYEPSHS